MSTISTGKSYNTSRDLATAMFLPDSILSTQWTPPASAEWTGERRLVLAVLQYAVRQWLDIRHFQTRRVQTLRTELEQWFMADDPQWIFSFVSCCHILGFDPQAVRISLFSKEIGPRLRRDSPLP